MDTERPPILSDEQEAIDDDQDRWSNEGGAEPHDTDDQPGTSPLIRAKWLDLMDENPSFEE